MSSLSEHDEHDGDLTSCRGAAATRMNTDAGCERAFQEKGDVGILASIAVATVMVHLVTGWRYGFHRDELALLEDSRHLAWGYVAYPPVTPFLGRLSLILFGTSLTGFRFFAGVAEAVAVVLTGLMARELGARRGAQAVAAAATLPVCLGGGTLMQYDAFDYLWWVLVAYFVVRLTTSDNPRWWLAIGTSVGLGMITKYTIGFFVVSIVAGMVLTDTRRYFGSKWFWMGATLSLFIFSPNLFWQIHHHFISLDFLRAIHARDVSIGRAQGLFLGQINMTLLGFPLWIAGLGFCLLSRSARKFQILGYAYVVALLLLLCARGRAYYLAPAYPMLYASGGVWGQQWLRSIGRGWANVIRAGVWGALAVDAVLAVVFFLPIAPIDSPWGRRVLKMQRNFGEEIGWQEMAQTVAEIRDSLPAQDRTHLGILAGNYGEAGAIDLYGPNHGLPRAISGMNSFWESGYGDPPPETLIVIGVPRDFLGRHFTTCDLAGHTGNRYSIENEEVRFHPDIYVCRGLRQSWPEFWNKFRCFG